jgi:hypothetical protein
VAPIGKTLDVTPIPVGRIDGERNLVAAPDVVHFLRVFADDGDVDGQSAVRVGHRGGLRIVILSDYCQRQLVTPIDDVEHKLASLLIHGNVLLRL